MQSIDTSSDDVPIDPDPQINLISSLRKENLYLQTKVDELQTELKKSHLLNVKNKKLNEKLCEANSEIEDLKCRLQISINQNCENKKQLNIERYTQNQICANGLSKLKNNMEQILQQKNLLSDENSKLKEKIDSLSNKYDIDIAFIQNQDRILLSSAASFFKFDFNTIEQLKDYFLSHSMPPSLLPEKDKVIDSQLIIINNLKSKCRSIKNDYESLLQQKQFEIDQQKQKISNQDTIINDLHKQIEQKIEFFTRKISKIKSKIPKKKRLYKFTSPTITIIPDPMQMLGMKTENENKKSNTHSSKLIENLNETVLQLQEENRKIQNDSVNYQIQLQKYKSENESNQVQVTNLKIELSSLKKEYEIKMKSANDKINELKLSSKIPDPITEQLISSAKNKIHQQKEKIILKESQLAKVTNEANHLKLIVSQQKVDIARLKAELANRSDHLCSQIFNDIEPIPITIPQEQPFFVFNYSELNSKLKPILRPIVENGSLSIESKLQIAIRKVDSFYMAKIGKLKKFKKINFSLENFISELFQLLIGRKIDIESLSQNSVIQAQVIEGLKDNKRKMDLLQSSSMNQNNEISNLNKKLTKAKEKLTSAKNHQKKIESLRKELEESISENEKLKGENSELERKVTLLKNENAELYSVLEYERGHIIQIKREQCSSLGEYEELLKKMKKKCNDQRKTIKCLAEFNC